MSKKLILITPCLFRQYRQWCLDMDEGRLPDGIQNLVEEVRQERDLQAQMNQLNARTPIPADAEMSESPT